MEYIHGEVSYIVKKLAGAYELSVEWDDSDRHCLRNVYRKYIRSDTGCHTVVKVSGESLHWDGRDHRFLEWADADRGGVWDGGGDDQEDTAFFGLSFSKSRPG